MVSTFEQKQFNPVLNTIYIVIQTDRDTPHNHHGARGHLVLPLCLPVKVLQLCAIVPVKHFIHLMNGFIAQITNYSQTLLGQKTT